MKGETRARHPSHFSRWGPAPQLCGWVLKPCGVSTSVLMDFLRETHDQNIQNFIEPLGNTEVMSSFSSVFCHYICASSQVESAKSRGGDTALKTPLFTVKVSKSLSHCCESQFSSLLPCSSSSTVVVMYVCIVHLLCKGGQPSSLQGRNRGWVLQENGGRKSRRRVCTSKEAGWVTRRTRKALREGAIGVQEKGKWENVPTVVLCPWAKRCLQGSATSPLLYSPPAWEILLMLPGFIHGGGLLSQQAEHWQCRAINAPGVGCASGKMMSAEASQNIFPRRWVMAG